MNIINGLLNYRGFLLQAALALIVLALAVTARFPAQIRGYAYGLYREAARVQAEYKYRNLSTLEGDHIRVKYQERDSKYAAMVLEASEKFYVPVAEKYGLKTGDKVTVLIYPNKEELNASFGWPSSENAMGVYWAGVIRILSPGAWVEDKSPAEMREDFINLGPMAHELTHLAVDYATRGNCPRWLTEGLAQMEEYHLTGFRFSYRQGESGGEFYSLGEMDRTFDELPDQALAYRESLSAVEYIESVYGEGKLHEIVSLLGSGRSMDQSITIALGVDPGAFEQNWRKWSGF
ncbi:MAG: peptidase MA family metallohydrolase [Bacillota bacterium]